MIQEHLPNRAGDLAAIRNDNIGECCADAKDRIIHGAASRGLE
jgi:hypothetical protein